MAYYPTLYLLNRVLKGKPEDDVNTGSQHFIDPAADTTLDVDEMVERIGDDEFETISLCDVRRAVHANSVRKRGKRAITVWNGLMAAFSLGMLVTWVWGYIYGPAAIVGTVRGTALVVYCATKPLEFVDSFLLVYRRRRWPPLVHHYHHFATTAMCTLALACYYTPGEVYAVMNLGVHTIMYGYFALRSAGVYIFPWIKRSITITQVLQMLIGLGASLYFIVTDVRPVDYADPGDLVVQRASGTLWRATSWGFTLLYASFVPLFGRLLIK